MYSRTCYSLLTDIRQSIQGVKSTRKWSVYRLTTTWPPTGLSQLQKPLQYLTWWLPLRIGPMSWLSSDKMIVDVKGIWKTLWLRNSDGRSISLIAESGDVEVYLKDWKIESNRRVDDGTCIMMEQRNNIISGAHRLPSGPLLSSLVKGHILHGPYAWLRSWW